MSEDVPEAASEDARVKNSLELTKELKHRCKKCFEN